MLIFNYSNTPEAGHFIPGPPLRGHTARVASLRSGPPSYSAEGGMGPGDEVSMPPAIIT